jgi:hypothetical protein
VSHEVLDAAASADSWWGAARSLAVVWWERDDPHAYAADRAVEWNKLSDLARELAKDGQSSGLLTLEAEFAEAAELMGVEAAAHAVCTAICMVQGQGFSYDWRSELGDRHMPEAGEPIPVSWRRAEGPSTFPPTLESHRDLFTHIRRAPGAIGLAGGPVQAEFDFSLWDLLGDLDLDPIPAVSAMHLNATVDELTWAKVYDARPFGVGPAEPDTQARLAIDALDLAIAEHAVLVVGTECADHATVTAALIARQLEAGSPAIVPGSRHLILEGDNFNVAYLLVGGETVEAHRKIVPMNLSAVKNRYPEDIVPGGLVRIFVSGSTRLAVLICRDALDEDLTKFMRTYGVNLLCVVALTPTLQPFRDEARTFSGRSQGVVVVANGPASVRTEGGDVDVNPPTALAVPLAEENAPLAPRPPDVVRGVTHLGTDGRARFEELVAGE